MRRLREVFVNSENSHPAGSDFQSVEYYIIALYGGCCCYDIIVLRNTVETINNNFKILRQRRDR